MNDLKTIRIFLSTIFLIASLGWLFIGPEINPMAIISVKSQIIPSAFAATIGATAFWLVATFVFGRLYCSSVCPVGTLQDISIWARRFFRLRPFRYRSSVGGKRARLTILVCYLICLVTSTLAFAWISEPWTILQSTAGLVRLDASITTWGSHYSWARLAGGISVGAIVSALILLIYLVWAVIDGRRFCNEFCPIGTALGIVTEYSVMHIEINPDKCINCMKCEEICPSHCVKVVSRYVDNARCVRCFNCLKVCPNDAIRYQRNRNRRQTPLLQRRKQFS